MDAVIRSVFIMIQAIMIFFGLSLDSFVAAMETGATLGNFTMKKRVMYTLIYSLISAGMFMAGILSGVLVKDLIPDKTEAALAAMMISVVGILLVMKGARSISFEEKLNRSFSIRSLLRIAFWTNLDTLVIGSCFTLLGIAPLTALILSFAVSAATIFIAYNVGYTLGAGYQRQTEICGGALMILFSITILIRFVLR